MCDDLPEDEIVDRFFDFLRNLSVPDEPPPEIVEATISALSRSRDCAHSKAAIKRIKWTNRKPTLAFAAALALIVVGLTTWLLPDDSHSGIAFGQVLQHIQSAKTMTCHGILKIKDQLLTFDSMMRGPRIRQVQANGNVFIYDASTGEALLLKTVERKAVLYSEYSASHGLHSNTLNWFDQLRTLQDQAGIHLGTKDVDGRLAEGFQVNRSELGGIRSIFWADRQTGVPICVEIELIAFDMTYVLSDFAFNVDLDPALFELTPPPGYAFTSEVQGNAGPPLSGMIVDLGKPDASNRQIDLEPSEQDLIDYLRKTTEVNNGYFLDRKNHAINPMMKAMESMQQSPENQKCAKQCEVIFKQLRVVKYAQKIQKETGMPPASLGISVKLGEADKIVMFWKLPDSDQYRVIFGDLSARNIEAEEFKKHVAQIPGIQLHDSKSPESAPHAQDTHER